MVSEFFIPIYESNFEKFEDAKSIFPIQKQANLIFCEREFISWLRNKFGNKLTNKTYPNYCTQKYFELFIPDFIKLKKKKKYILKKEAILQQLISDLKFPTIKKHEYDIDIVETYFTLKKLLETHLTNEELKKRHLDLFFDPIQNYCSENEMSLDRVLQLNYPIVKNNTSINFEAFLGRTLMVCDINKIAAILGYQRALWNSDLMFATFVEHPVYKYVFHNGLFENNDRLVKIMDWVEKNRTFVTVDDTKENKEKDPSLKYGETIVMTKEFYYWSYSEEKLMSLHDLLITNNKIENNDFFQENFKTYIEFTRNPIVWKTSNIELMFLLDLIYKQEAQYKSFSLQNIAHKLFESNKRVFTSKGLNTALLQAKRYHSKGVKLSPGIKSIKDIIDSLELY